MIMGIFCYILYYCALVIRIARIFEHDAKTKHQFPKIFIELYICLVVATTLQVTKVLCFSYPCRMRGKTVTFGAKFG